MEATKQRPSLGRTVILAGVKSNGADEHPAVVTRVWTDESVNLQVLLDAAAPMQLTSIPLFASRDLGAAAGHPIFAYWPART